MRLISLLAVTLSAGCGGAVASEVAASDGGTSTAHDEPVDAGPPNKAVREVQVTPAPLASLNQLVFAHEPTSCGNGLPACASGRCVVYEVPASSPGYVCVEGDICAPLHCAVGRCGRGDDNLDNNYRCNPYGSPCEHDRDCDSEHPYCIHVRHSGSSYGFCARDYASACTYAGCAAAPCIVTESDPIAIRCAP